MRCKEVEKILIVGEEADEKLRAAAAEHIAHCGDCARFRAGLMAMKSIKPASSPDLPRELELSTRFSAHAQLRRKKSTALRQVRIFDLPLPVAAAVTIIIGLTIYWICTGMGNIPTDGPLPAKTLVSLFILVQNLLMLILSPLLLKNRKGLQTVNYP